MNNREILIVVLIVVLIVIKFYKYCEGFESNPNNFPCSKNPFNPNCTCPPDAPVQTILGEFPMNYGEKSPYFYTCVPKNSQEPNTNSWPNPPY